MSWSSCMQNKVVSHYGSEVENCVKGITHGNFSDILKCIAEVKGIADPEAWIAEQLAFFTEWSLECAF